MNSEKAASKRKTWLGGYVRKGKRGEVFIIERWVDGIHLHVSTRCRTQRAALKELERFEAAPFEYDPTPGPPADKRVLMTAELVDEHERWQLDVKKNTARHVHDCAKVLEGWLEVLYGRDLRELRGADLKDALGKWTTARRKRVIAIKGFFRWLRQEKNLLARHEDPALDLPVPPARPEKLTRKKVVELADVRRALAHLNGLARDVVQLIAATGMHVTEVGRFASEGALTTPTPDQRAQGALINVTFRHKGGQPHTVDLQEAAAVEAAKRIKARGRGCNVTHLHDSLLAACDAAGVERFTPGVLRHSHATWLVQAGWSLQQVSERLGHRSPATTRAFYVDMGMSAAPRRLPKLRLVAGGKG